MKILVTGATGRIGRALWIRLAHAHEVQGLDRAPSSTAQWVGEVDDPALLRRALHGVQAVVHCAALHAPQVGLLPDTEFHRINIDATALLARLAAEAGVQQLVYTSTTALYGHAATPAQSAGWVDEQLTAQPRTIYHRSKLAAEALLESFAQESGMAITALRMSRCFPEPAPLMAAYRLHRGVDARDVAAAHELALLRNGPGFRKYVISGATPFQPEDAAELLHDAPRVLARRAPALVEAFARRGWALPKMIDRIYDPGLAQRELGWQARFGFEEVLRMVDAESGEVLPVSGLSSAVQE